MTPDVNPPCYLSFQPGVVWHPILPLRYIIQELPFYQSVQLACRSVHSLRQQQHETRRLSDEKIVMWKILIVRICLIAGKRFLAQSLQQKHQTKVRNLFKVNHQEIRTVSLLVFMSSLDIFHISFLLHLLLTLYKQFFAGQLQRQSFTGLL